MELTCDQLANRLWSKYHSLLESIREEIREVLWKIVGMIRANPKIVDELLSYKRYGDVERLRGLLLKLKTLIIKEKIAQGILRLASKRDLAKFAKVLVEIGYASPFDVIDKFLRDPSAPEDVKEFLRRCVLSSKQA